MPLILPVSKDPVLLKIREQILQREGYVVKSCSSISEAICTIHSCGSLDLLLLGHTLTKDERLEVEECARTMKPDIPMVFICSNRWHPGESGPNTFEISPASPEQLIFCCKIALGGAHKAAGR